MITGHMLGDQPLPGVSEPELDMLAEWARESLRVYMENLAKYNAAYAREFHA